MQQIWCAEAGGVIMNVDVTLIARRAEDRPATVGDAPSLPAFSTFPVDRCFGSRPDRPMRRSLYRPPRRHCRDCTATVVFGTVVVGVHSMTAARDA